MKKLVIIRGGQREPLKKEKDSFDSVINVFLDDSLTKYQTIQNVNTDFFNGYHGGILAEGKYSGIVYDRADTGRRAIKLFDRKYLSAVIMDSNITEPMRIFPSLIPNPNHNGKAVITQVLIHSDGQQGGYSNGCITIYPDQWAEFIKLFQLGEIVDIELIRAPGWKAPDFYQGK